MKAEHEVNRDTFIAVTTARAIESIGGKHGDSQQVLSAWNLFTEEVVEYANGQTLGHLFRYVDRAGMGDTAMQMAVNALDDFAGQYRLFIHAVEVGE